MFSEKAKKYWKSTFVHPGRTMLAAFSEVTRIPIPVQFKIREDNEAISGILPEVVSRFTFLAEGIRDYEPETNLMIKHLAQANDTCLVIGAHIGLHAILAKHCVGQYGKVVGFEPTPSTYNLLESNCHQRGIITENMAITKQGVDQVVLTELDLRHCAWNSIVEVRSKDISHWQAKKQIVTATSIDKYCDSHQLKPNLLILDLENGEMDALSGGENTIKSYMPNIIIECGDMGRSQENNTYTCLSLLQNWGYIFF